MVSLIHLKMAVLPQHMREVTRICTARCLESPDRAGG